MIELTTFISVKYEFLNGLFKKPIFAFSVLFFVSQASFSQVQATCEGWPEAERKLTDLRKTIGCDMHYNMSECMKNLGLAAGATAGVGLAAKKAIDAGAFRTRFSPPAADSCGLYGMNQKDDGFLYVRFILSKAYAAGTTCKSWYKVKTMSEELQAKVKAQNEKVKAQIQEIVKEKNLKQVMAENPRLAQLHREQFDLMVQSLAETDVEKSNRLAEKGKAVGRQIEQYIQTVTGSKRETVKVLSSAMRMTLLLGDAEVGNKYWQQNAPDPLSTNDPRIAKLEKEVASLQRLDNDIARWPRSPENLARQLESAAEVFPDEKVKDLAKMRVALAEVAPDVAMRESSALARKGNFLRTGSVARNGGKILLKAASAGIGLGVTILAEAASPTVAGCATLQSEYVNMDKDNDCKPPRRMDDDFKKYVMLEPEQQKAEFCKVPAISTAVRDYHEAYFPSNVEVQCKGEKVVYRDNKRRSIEEMSFDSTGNPKQYVYKVSNDLWNDQIWDFENDVVKQLTLVGRNNKKVIPGERITTTMTQGFFLEVHQEHFETSRPRLLEFHSCCAGQIDMDDSRCEVVKRSQARGSGGKDQSGISGSSQN